MRAVVVGAGAAGCFAAAELARLGTSVTVLEASRRPLAKVNLTGGGRCNITNTFEQAKSMQSVYPRGARLLERLFRQFGPRQTMQWWQDHGVQLVTMDDGCVFPASQDARQVSGTLTTLMSRRGVQLRTQCRVTDVGSDLTVTLSNGERLAADRVIYTTGGGAHSPLAELGLRIEPLAPSLFSVRIADEALTALQGAVAREASVTLCGTGIRAEGPLLVTDWGLSGPAILKLSSRGARELQAANYRLPLAVNWTGVTQDEARAQLEATAQANPRRQVANAHPQGLTARLWQYIVIRARVPASTLWGQVTAKAMARLTLAMTADTYTTDGRCPYRQEFVTCGGVSLSELDHRTLECRKVPGLYIAGEVADVDGITGGYNLQAAWTMGMVAARHACGE